MAGIARLWSALAAPLCSELAVVDAPEPRQGAVAEQGEGDVPAETDAGGILGLQLADVDRLDVAVLEPGEAVRLVEVDGVHGAQGAAADGPGLVVGLEVRDHDRDPVVEH